jgi:hypothetical protein
MTSFEEDRLPFLFFSLLANKKDAKMHYPFSLQNFRKFFYPPFSDYLNSRAALVFINLLTCHGISGTLVIVCNFFTTLSMFPKIEPLVVNLINIFHISCKKFMQRAFFYKFCVCTFILLQC